MFSLHIRTGNAAFQPIDEDDSADIARGHGVAHILRDLAKRLEAGDSNSSPFGGCPWRD